MYYKAADWLSEDKDSTFSASHDDLVSRAHNLVCDAHRIAPVGMNFMKSFMARLVLPHSKINMRKLKEAG